MKSISRLLLSAIIGLGCVPTLFTNSHALGRPTHKIINRYIAENELSGFSLDSYLKDQLGFQDGKDSNFNNEKAWEWIRDGGAFEDEPFLRSVNHFHNPLTKQGFTDLSWLLWGFFGVLNGESSVQWAQRPMGTQSPGGRYSWHDARDHFYKALTPNSETDRQQNFAETFRGLGQLMHLVEDSSVPEHTRNSLHGLPFTYEYEAWLTDKDGITTPEKLSNYLSQYPPIFFDPSTIGDPNPFADIPVANLFDTSQYNGTNPNVTLQNNVGLSEYTNANFLCPGTMFTSDFPYPNWNSVIQSPAPDPVTGKWYLTKLGMNDPQGNGERIEHLAVSRWGDTLLSTSIRQSGISLKMDKQVYADYAAKLIPRAVGYAAGLLNYFFRGQIDIASSQWTNTDVKFKIRNNSLNEAMGPGTLVVSYEFYGSNYGVSSEVQLNETIPAGAESSNEYSVTFPQSVPSGLSGSNTRFWFVFRGKLGNEDDAVVAKATVGSAQFSSIGCVAGCASGQTCGASTLFHVPPIADGGGSFTVDATDLFDNYFHYKVACSYSTGYMNCDIIMYYQSPLWHNNELIPCARDHCEGTWDGNSFYKVCDFVSDYTGACYYCDPNDRRFWIQLFTK